MTYKTVGKSVEKIDSLALACGEEKFTDDFPLDDPLYIKILHSPHAHAIIEEIDASEALKVDGVVKIYTYKDITPILYSSAGQGFPEPSPYDNLILDKRVRYVGDNVAFVVAESEEIAEIALKKINVKYKKLDANFDLEKAMDDETPKLHMDNGAYMPIPTKYVPEKNLAAEIVMNVGDIEKGLTDADTVLDQTYSTHYGSHCALEPHTSCAYIDERNRMVIISATQVPYHVRRIVSKIVEIPIRNIRVIKPRIGGGFGGKQEILLEPIVALVTKEFRRPSRITFTRKEVFTSSRTRHPIRAHVKIGYNKNGDITAIDYDALLNTGAYGSHGLTVLSNVGAKILPFFNKVKHVRFLGRTVYTNLPVGGAYRGYGATQSGFAFAQMIDIIARDTGIDVLEYWKENHIKEGETSEIFKALGEGTEGVLNVIHSCKLDECIDRGAKEIGWYDKRGKKIKVGNKIKGMGVACSMQGSAIPEIDMASAYIKMNEDGSFNMNIGATDIGTGSDTILAQIAAEEIGCNTEDFIVLSSDTDLTPFDTGAYASSTTYLSGEAVRKAAGDIKNQILEVASEILDVDVENLSIQNSYIMNGDNQEMHMGKICEHALYTHNQFQIQATASHVVHLSPPPFIAQFAEVNVDTETGEIELVKFVSAVDCGQAINPILVEGQVEGATVNGICYALDEEYRFNKNGVMTNASFGKYKIYTARDLPEMKTIVVESHEETGPFGAKSVAEVGINGPMPAIANAIYDAVGVRIFHAPLKAEKVFKGLKEQRK